MRKLMLIVIISTCSFAQTNIVEFFETFYTENSMFIDTVYNKEYKQFCKSEQIDINNDYNRDIFNKLYFMHQAFTTSSPINGLNDGLLGIPYYDKRSRIEYIDNATKIDRTPAMFLGDLVDSIPKYWDQSADKPVFTFGWCAEREMAFMALLQNMGFEGTIVAAGGHAWSELQVKLYVNNKLADYVLHIDNTFERFDIVHVDWVQYPRYLHDCREYNWNCEICLMTDFYNPRSYDRIDTIMVSDFVKQDISALLQIKLCKLFKSL
jgi:hypothetical protein